MANELTYQSVFTGQEMDERFAAVAQLQAALLEVETALSAKYVKPASGIPETDLDSAVQSALAKARSAVQDLSNYYTKTEIDSLLAAVNSQEYVDVATLPTASASTLGKIYLVGPTDNEYDRYYTSYDGSDYSWVAAGSTEINLANYATKAELNQLDQKVDERTLNKVWTDVTDDMVLSKYIKNNGAVGSTVDVNNPATNGTYCYIIIPVTTGQKVKVKGGSGSEPRLWCLTDSAYKILSNATANVVTTTYIELTATKDGYCICNCTKTSSSYPRSILVEEGIPIKTEIDGLKSRTATLESGAAAQAVLNAATDAEMFGLDTQPWVFKETKAVAADASTVFLDYLGKCDCVFKVESAASNYIRIRGVNKATGSVVSLYEAQVQQATFPLEIANPRPDVELINVGLYGFSTTTPADFTLTITKNSPVLPLTQVMTAKKYLADCIAENFKSEDKYVASDYVAMDTSEVYAAYDALVSAYPSYVSRTELGEVESAAVGNIPAETNKMYRYDFTPTWPSGSTNVPKLRVMILTGTHPEHMAIRALLKIMTSICSDWESSPALEFLRFNVHFVIIPVASPWAVNHQSRVNANGVDMARNYPAGWVEGSYVAPPSSTSTYGGSEPLCETEAELINGVFESLKDGLVAAIDFHNNYSTANAFWLPCNSGDSFMATVAANFLKLIPRQLTKYEAITPTTMIGYLDMTNPGGSFGYNAGAEGVEGLTFETTQEVLSDLDDLGDTLTIAHDGFINFLIVLLRALMARQYSHLVSPV